MNHRQGTPDPDSDRFIQTVCGRLSQNQRVRRTLPERGRLHIDRQLPFLCVYRRPRLGQDVGTERLVVSEASYLIASAYREPHKQLDGLVRHVCQKLAEPFGSVLILEVWSATHRNREDGVPRGLQPAFKIVAPNGLPLSSTVETFRRALENIRVGGLLAEVEVVRGGKASPPGLPPLLSEAEASQLGCAIIGLEVQPIYRDPETGELFPTLLRTLRRGLSRALKQTFFVFASTQTTHRPSHYHALGRRAMVKAVWEVDRQLAEVCSAFDFQLQVTPVNAASAWSEFNQSRFERTPAFYYRPLTVEPALLKRKLYAIPIERIEDATIAQLLREKQEELDRKITMLQDLGSPRFTYGSLQLFAGVDRGLLGLAEELLRRLPPRSRENGSGPYLAAEAFAQQARAEIEHYRSIYPGFSAGVEVRDDLFAGLMVSDGSLLVGRQTRVPAGRAQALIQHEVGTHLLTYYNGRAQPFRQLYSGLAGYEELQEGLAVLSEYLVGGLSRPRWRMLAARVIAARLLIDGASFVDTFRALERTYGFARRTAYTITMRAYRGGGLTKDAVYLRGLGNLLAYLQGGGQLDSLFIGKIAAKHVPIMGELHMRGVLRPVPVWPRYLSTPETSERLQWLRRGVSVLDLIPRR